MAESESITDAGVDDDEEDAVPVGAALGRRGRGDLFSKEIKMMLYGFGDDENPYKETVSLLEELAVSYICSVSRRAAEVGKSGRIGVEDIEYVVRRDPKKYSRVRELLTINEVLKRARKAFDDPESAAQANETSQ
ncbi:hypothetical protein BOX15_Mlig021758g1 [Macrostomum lignano]|uniref:Transcription initiation factor TFIID subunit 13 n=1 Tax=Macrostomum lignano TaxID=282301 RepID=A0A267DRZ8_9PLAT|nr:hypothetical protein BOX15_Mlig015417g1 [Macrostomum lignano]PAA51926.1 hypothetical protein BOX15_Mlig021758g1 [Macrostomum lignano]